MKSKIDLLKVKERYNEGVNIMQALREELNTTVNTSQIIEISYDMQSGSYIGLISDATDRYFHECKEILKEFADHAESILDAGAGELTTTAHLINKLAFKGEVYAFDISWSRLKMGSRYYAMSNNIDQINYFVADMKNIPLSDNSIDLVYTNHALEPNHGSEEELLSELNRVARKKIVLFEPYYEGVSDVIRKRMDQHNYIRNLEHVIKKVGCKLEKIIPIKNTTNQMNPTFAFIITPSGAPNSISKESEVFTCPQSLMPLRKLDSCYYCEKSFLA
jgi:ubiquinone/menaquinone biosynthesis C-methylase UbiE